MSKPTKAHFAHVIGILIMHTIKCTATDILSLAMYDPIISVTIINEIYVVYDLNQLCDLYHLYVFAHILQLPAFHQSQASN